MRTGIKNAQIVAVPDQDITISYFTSFPGHMDKK